MARGNPAQAAHVTHLPVQMDRKEETRPVPDCCISGSWIHARIVLVHVHHRYPSAGVYDRLEGGDEGHRRHYHLVPFLEAKCTKSNRQRVEPTPRANREPATAGLGEFALEELDGRPVHESACVEQLGDVTEKSALDSPRRWPKIDERNRDSPLVSARHGWAHSPWPDNRSAEVAGKGTKQ